MPGADRLHDRLLRHQFTGMRDEHGEHVERARADGEPCGTACSILPEQPAAVPIEAETAEQEHVMCDGRVHAFSV